MVELTFIARASDGLILTETVASAAAAAQGKKN
jgi:hypothetical protein